LAWDEISKTSEAVKAYLDEWVFGVADRTEYWKKLGSEVHERLKVASRPVPHRLWLLLIYRITKRYYE